MEQKIRDELKELTNKILRSVSAKKIFLFGSHAYGSPDPNSDIDICILTEEQKRKIDIMTEIREEIGFSPSYPLDILVYQPDEFYIRADSKTSMENKILKDGIVLYG
jgi:predicted nucleotidyltransferase